MFTTRGSELFVALTFCIAIAIPAAIQTTGDIARSERPQALDVFLKPPTAERLRDFEQSLEKASLVGRTLRPWSQYLQYLLLNDTGSEVIVGRDNWLFYRPSYEYLTRRPPAPSSIAAVRDPVPAIVSFRDQLASRGIALVVVPAPNKESIYPELLSNQEPAKEVIVCPETSQLLKRLDSAGVAVVNLFEVFRAAKQQTTEHDREGLYLPHDSHWSSRGMQLAAHAVARHALDRGLVVPGDREYEARKLPVERVGDVVEMLRTPQIEALLGPHQIECRQIVQRDTGTKYKDDPAAEVLVLGDSFLRIYQEDEPGAAGFPAHLAYELKQPLSTLIADGGASTLVRQELVRRKTLLNHKKLVIWEFVERDISYGAEGWQVIELPQLARQEKGHLGKSSLHQQSPQNFLD